MIHQEKAAKYTLRNVIETSLKLLSPIVPFFAEEVYQYFGDGESIHKTSWPEVNEDLVSEDYENKGNITVDLIDEVRRFKSSSKIPLNAQLAEVNVYTNDENLVEIFDEFSHDIEGTLKIDDLSIKTGKPEVHEKSLKLNLTCLKSDRCLKDAGKIIGYLKSTDIEKNSW